MSTASIASDVARINRALARFEHHESHPGRYGRTTRHRGDAAMVGTRERYAQTMAAAERVVRYAAKCKTKDPAEAIMKFERAVQSGKSPGHLAVSRESGVKRRPARDRMASFRKWQDQIGQWASRKGLSADELAEAIEYRRGGSGKPRSQRRPKGQRRPRRQYGTKMSGGRR